MAFDGQKPFRLRARRRSPLRAVVAAVVPVAVIGAGAFVLAKGRLGAAMLPVSVAPVAAPKEVPSVRALGPSSVNFPEEEAAFTLDLSSARDAETQAPVEDATPLDEDGSFDEADGDGTPSKPASARRFATVHEAAKNSCTTESIEGLSKQIIEESRCINPNAVVPLPSRPNLVTGPHVFPYLHVEARTHLLKVLDAHKKTTLKVNSALRTVAQQYLVWRWSATKSCGVELATRPGESSHELGLALDIADHQAWRGALESEKFRWLGATDRVHFDFKPAAPAKGSMTDVLAFQRLWNRNHPADRLREDGLYSPATEEKLKESPPAGFAVGAVCKPVASRSAPRKAP
jgi:hypothetical protein